MNRIRFTGSLAALLMLAGGTMTACAATPSKAPSDDGGDGIPTVYIAELRDQGTLIARQQVVVFPKFVTTRRMLAKSGVTLKAGDDPQNLSYMIGRPDPDLPMTIETYRSDDGLSTLQLPRRTLQVIAERNGGWPAHQGDQVRVNYRLQSNGTALETQSANFDYQVTLENCGVGNSLGSCKAEPEG